MAQAQQEVPTDLQDSIKRITERVQISSDEITEKEDAAQRALKIQKRQERINLLMENSGIAPRFREKTLGNYSVYDPRQAEAVKACQWFLSAPKDCPGMIFLGNTGTGKNHLCAGIVNYLISARLATVLMTEPVKMIRAIKESWKREGVYESEIIKKFRDPDLLVIDEIGVQFESKTERMYLTEIINDRYAWERPTILAGNVTLQELRGIIGDRAVERFREGGKLVLCDWESYRGRKA